MKPFFCFMALALFFLVPSVTQAADTGRALEADLASDHVDISIGFNGADFTLFGVKKKPGALAVIVRGPGRDTIVRRKSRTLGIWMNTAAVEFLDVPVYYDFAVSVPERALAPVETLRKFGIGLDALDIRVEKNEAPQVLDSFHEALIRHRQAGGHFPLSPKPITFVSEDFFRVNFHVPADVPPGAYIVETLLFDRGVVVDRRETRLRVAQVGFSANVHNFADRHGFLYGLVAIGLALLSGAGAHLFFRRTA